MLPSGISQLSNTSSVVEEAQIPSLSSVFPTLKPGVPFSMRKKLSPLWPIPLSVIAVTTATCAGPPLVMKFLVPLRTHLPFFSSAVVLVPAASEPASGSVMPKQPIYSPVVSFVRYFCLSSSDAK